ncbi:hypothetical protein XU18_2707 [Perkinsela sp. CCAP 1560/4]|nr:hypothetical protein XU18_2707 [Perkinsela sp. CCAP 1560/4]|eukprot:KNH06425.1 hypothetical protein XU18_2707 [Perkinsela sp. CCAP 1560/4]
MTNSLWNTFSEKLHNDRKNEFEIYWLIRRKATSSLWVGPVPRRGGSQETSKLSLCFCFGADPIDGRRKVVGQDPYPSMGGSGNRRLLLWEVPDPPGGETRERPLILCGTKSGMELAHTNKDKTRGHVHTC